MPEIQPHWNQTDHPNLWNRTSVKYNSIKLADLKARELDNIFFNELVPLLPFGCYIAGGFISSHLRGKPETCGDIDLYFNGTEAFEKTLELLYRPTHRLFEGYSTPFNREQIESKETPVVKFTAPGKLPIQLIKIIWCDNVEHVIDGFDFTVCQFAIDGDNLVFNPIAMMDLYTNKLMLHRVEHHMDCLFRLTKYVKKGYDVPSETLDKLTQVIVSKANASTITVSPIRRRRRSGTLASGSGRNPYSANGRPLALTPAVVPTNIPSNNGETNVNF